jgi:hypothetical protein
LVSHGHMGCVQHNACRKFFLIFKTWARHRYTPVHVHAHAAALLAEVAFRGAHSKNALGL